MLYSRNYKDFAKDIKRWFYSDNGIQMFGTYWYGFGGVITAGHVLSEAGLRTPQGTPKFDDWQHRMRGVDISTHGFENVCPAVTAPYEGQEIVAMGYPAGSRHLEYRRGWVHMEREDGIWIGAFKDPNEPVVVGMSGGMVVGKDKYTGKWTPIGVIIHRNSPTDVNRDRIEDESCDFVALNYAFEESVGFNIV